MILMQKDILNILNNSKYKVIVFPNTTILRIKKIIKSKSPRVILYIEVDQGDL